MKTFIFIASATALVSIGAFATTALIAQIQKTRATSGNGTGTK